MEEKPSELRALQLKCLEILELVHQICVEGGIRYSLNGGTVVGAHLYGRMLPWDDDIDLMMAREEYNKFVRLCPSKLPEGYRMVNYHVCDRYDVLFTKIEDTRTTLVQLSGEQKIVSGVFIDVACYDKVPCNYLKSFVLFVNKMVQWIFCATYSDSPRCVMDYLRNTWLRIFGKYPTWVYKIAQWIYERCGNISKRYVYSELMFGHTIPFRPSVFENYTTISFEGKQYMIVRDYIEYLQTRYNRTDFREPEDKQVPPHYSYVNLAMPYREYCDLQQKATSDRYGRVDVEKDFDLS